MNYVVNDEKTNILSFTVRKLNTKQEVKNSLARDQFSSYGREDIVIITKLVSERNFQPRIVYAIKDRNGLLTFGMFFETLVENITDTVLEGILSL